MAPVSCPPAGSGGEEFPASKPMEDFDGRYTRPPRYSGGGLPTL